jgi:hypothetical protein
MYLWRSTAQTHSFKAHEDLLQANADGRLVILQRSARKRVQLEIVCGWRKMARALLKEFGGRVHPLRRDCLERVAEVRESKPIQIGKRLIIFGAAAFQRPRRLEKPLF